MTFVDPYKDAKWSFVLVDDKKNVLEASNLETKLREFEQQDRRSYFFDDCHINLKITYL